MYCPRCAKEFESGTSYCRTCGLSLDGVAAIVKGEAETEPEMRTAPNGKLMRIGIGTFILGFGSCSRECNRQRSWAVAGSLRQIRFLASGYDRDAFAWSRHSLSAEEIC